LILEFHNETLQSSKAHTGSHNQNPKLLQYRIRTQNETAKKITVIPNFSRNSSIITTTSISHNKTDRTQQPQISHSIIFSINHNNITPHDPSFTTTSLTPYWIVSKLLWPIMWSHCWNKSLSIHLIVKAKFHPKMDE
jgi:hypothetical protein